MKINDIDKWFESIGFPKNHLSNEDCIAVKQLVNKKIKQARVEMIKEIKEKAIVTGIWCEDNICSCAGHELTLFLKQLEKEEGKQKRRGKK